MLCCMYSFRHFFLASLLGSFFIPTSRAVTLDWDTVTSAAGSLSNSYDFAIGDITFTPVPEINPAWGAFGSCLVAAALILRHSAKFRK
ncbi:MAG: hypothetical protein QOI07_2948 [Verrucomicrobiota bacterium]